MIETNGAIMKLSKNALSNVFDFVDELEYLKMRAVNTKVKAAADLVIVRLHTERETQMKQLIQHIS